MRQGRRLCAFAVLLVPQAACTPAPITVYSACDALWVTDHAAGNLWRITP